jgi:hypothetical protein
VTRAPGWFRAVLRTLPPQFRRSRGEEIVAVGASSLDISTRVWFAKR